VASVDAAAAMTFVTSDGVRLNVIESGPESAPLTLVLLHGWVMDHRTWDDVVDRLPGVKVLRFDFRGHGRSDRGQKAAMTMDRLADDIAEVITERVSGKVILGGHSLGGMALLALAQRHPGLVADRVAGVAFVNTTAGGLSALDFRLPRWLAAPILFIESLANPVIARLPQRGLLGRLSSLGWLFIRFLAFGRKPARGHVGRVAKQLALVNPAAMVAFRHELKIHERLPAVSGYQGIPAIVLAGDRDRLCTVEHARAITAELPGATLEVYPGAGHMLSYERTDAVVAHLSTLVALEPGIQIQATA
jgi:pimeloyl-ACP methyl ester carboxylesterase